MQRKHAIVLAIILSIFFDTLGQQRVVQRSGNANSQATEISSKTKKSVKATLLERIKENYAFPEEIADIQGMLDELSKSEQFKKTNDANMFGRMMTGALRDFTNDPHFNVLYNPQMYEMLEQMMSRAASGATPQGGPRMRTSSIRGGVPDEKKNYNLSKVEVLPGNIGYLRINMMPDINMAKPTVDAAMAFLANVDAFILDLRSNPGGVGGFTPYLASYFFEEEKKLLFTREFPAYDSANYFYTEPDLPGTRLVEQPLYILINQFTGSAASNFSYTMQNHGRAKVVGATAGEGVEGGHSAGGFPLADGFIATVPIANVVHPVTGTNWSMTGVVPDVKTESEQALKEANKLILTELIQKEDNASMKGLMQGALADLERENDEKPAAEAIDVSALKEFVGDYESRKVLLEGSKLYYLRGGQPKLEMQKVDKDLFKIVLPPNAMSRAGGLPLIRFDRNDAGNITKITFVSEDGDVVGTAEKKK